MPSSPPSSSSPEAPQTPARGDQPEEYVRLGPAHVRLRQVVRAVAIVVTLVAAAVCVY